MPIYSFIHILHSFEMRMSLQQKIRHKLRKRAREAWFNASFKALDRIPKAITNARGLRILVYHGVCPGDAHAFNARYVSVRQLEANLLLIKRFYNPVSYEDLLSGHLSNDKLNVLLTFDDGLKNNYTQALPLLKRHQVPALFFVTGLSASSLPYIFNDLTDIAPLIGPPQISIDNQIFYRTKIYRHYRYVNAQGQGLAAVYHKASQAKREEVMQALLGLVPKEQLEAYGVYHELMSDEEIRALGQAPGMSVASHGQYHTSLPALSPGDLISELEASRHYLEQLCGQPVQAIAFPYGDYNQQVVDACKKAGYRHCFGTDQKHHVATTISLFERFTINPYVSAINQAYYIAMNHYE